MDYKIHNSFDTLSIYAYSKLIETNDLKCLIDEFWHKNIDFTDELRKELVNAYENIMKDNKEFDLKLSKLFYDYLYDYFRWKFDNKHNINNSFDSYLKYLDSLFKNFKYNELTFANTKDLIQYIQNKYDFKTAIELRHIVFDYKNLTCEHKSKFNLNKELSNILRVLKIQVDKYKMSVNEFKELQLQLKETLQNG